MTTNVQNYRSWFESICGWSPHAWQAALGEVAECDNRLIRIPTGMGKTEGVFAAWLFHSVGPAFQPDRSKGQPGKADVRGWPQRLVWCLPMRVLVEQTVERCRAMIDRWADAAGVVESNRPRVHVLMGGEDTDRWWLEPERHAVLVGTQDMLLSRALNRGYGSARARWPMEYALLNQDCLWVMDEIQLMDVGLATSAQMQAFRDQDRSKQLRPCYTWWMSATLQPEWLLTVDSREQVLKMRDRLVSIDAKHRRGSLWENEKPLHRITIPSKTKDVDRNRQWAETILEAHRETVADSTGRVTLVIVNRVDDAQAIHKSLASVLKESETTVDVRLIHSRFRSLERQAWSGDFLNRSACEDPAVDRIIVATQVVEAGVDISATALVTELAPWPSLVQRFGRAGRYGGASRVIVVDPDPDEKSAKPYELADLTAAREAIERLSRHNAGLGVGLAALEAFEDELRNSDPTFLSRLYRYEYVHLLNRREFDELFDTSPDLTGADLDISRFIRSGDERDVQVFWAEISESETNADTSGGDAGPRRVKIPSPDLQPLRDGLCAVPVYRVRNWLFKSGRLKDGCHAWVWDFLDGRWIRATPAQCFPGQTILVDASWGGYDIERGFTGDKRKAKDPLVPTDGCYRTQADVELADEGQPRDDRSRQNVFKTIATHGREVAMVAVELVRQLGLGDQLAQLLELAGLWHDWGKAHPAFQCNIVLGENDPPRHDLAKAPNWVHYLATQYNWPEQCRDDLSPHGKRRGFRHELASTIALFELLVRVDRNHEALLGPWQELVALGVLSPAEASLDGDRPPDELARSLAELSAEQFNLLAYLICCHHGKVRGQWQATPHDQDFDSTHEQGIGVGMPIRGVRDGDALPPIELGLPGGGTVVVPEVTLHLDLAAAGLSSRYGAGWTDRVLSLRKLFGPTTLALLETLLRVADARGSAMETRDPLLNTYSAAVE